MKLSVRNAVFPALLALAACSGGEKDDSDVKTTATVKTIAVQTADVPEILTAYGATEVAMSGEQTLTAPMEAVVAAVRVQQGVSVDTGQTLIEMKPSPASAAEIARAAADLDVASKAYARAERLRADGLDGDADVEQARAAEATAEEAQRSLASRIKNGLVVRAPDPGVVESLTATPGDLVAAGAALGKFGSAGAIQVRLGLEASDIWRVQAGDAVTVRTVDGRPAGQGRVTTVESRVDPQTRLADAVVEVRAGLAVGQAVVGDIVLRTVRATTAPKAAVVYDQAEPAVFVVSGGVAHRRTVTLGPVQGDTIAILGGLNAGERVVTEGAGVLDDGMAVADAGASGRSDSHETRGGKSGGDQR